MICERCGGGHDGSYGSGRFCSITCANTRVITEETKEKMRQAQLGVNHKERLTEKGLQSLRENQLKTAKRRKERRDNDFLILTWDELIEKYNKSDWLSDIFRQKVINEQEGNCFNCGNNEWMGEKIPLEVHHKDGTKSHRRDNLVALCLNCHGLTETWKVKNIHR